MNTYQTFVSRQRLYIFNHILYTINITTAISGKHILANKEDLIKLQGLLLDTVIFK
jgi:hypothetical protein